MKLLLIVALVVILFNVHCTSNPTVDEVAGRKVASLDNNTETVLDPALETQLDPNEEAKFNAVATTVAEFVTKQSQLRGAHSQDQKQGVKDTLKDLPQVSQDGKPIPDEIKNSYATRDVHRKTHGCYAATLDVSAQIQDRLDQQISTFISQRKAEGPETSTNRIPEPITKSQQLGIFQPGAHYDAIVRYSNGHPGYRPDHDPDARGMALKILPSGSLTKPIYQTDVGFLNEGTILDILTINFPTFFVNDPGKYNKLNEDFLKGAQDFRGALSANYLQSKSILFDGLTSLEKQLALLANGSIIYSSLFQKYFSMVPSRLGPKGDVRAVKYAFFPEACEGKSTKFESDVQTQWPDWSKRHDYSLVTKPLAKDSIPPFDIDGDTVYPHDYLRNNIKTRLEEGPVCFALMFQLYRDQLSTNIEDSTDIWISDTADKADWISKVKMRSFLGSAYYKKLDAKSFSPYIKVATLRISQISDDYPAQNTKTCEDLSFSPWNGKISLHKPLGIVSRMKRRVYNASRATRHTINRLPTQSWERPTSDH